MCHCFQKVSILGAQVEWAAGVSHKLDIKMKMVTGSEIEADVIDSWYRPIGAWLHVEVILKPLF